MLARGITHQSLCYGSSEFLQILPLAVLKEGKNLGSILISLMFVNQNCWEYFIQLLLLPTMQGQVRSITGDTGYTSVMNQRGSQEGQVLNYVKALKPHLVYIIFPLVELALI